MGNMSYCRFENTYHDLKDCYNHLDDCSSESEKKYRIYLLKLCEKIAEIAEEYID